MRIGRQPGKYTVRFQVCLRPALLCILKLCADSGASPQVGSLAPRGARTLAPARASISLPSTWFPGWKWSAVCYSDCPAATKGFLLQPERLWYLIPMGPHFLPLSIPCSKPAFPFQGGSSTSTASDYGHSGSSELPVRCVCRFPMLFVPLLPLVRPPFTLISGLRLVPLVSLGTTTLLTRSGQHSTLKTERDRWAWNVNVHIDTLFKRALLLWEQKFQKLMNEEDR